MYHPLLTSFPLPFVAGITLFSYFYVYLLFKINSPMKKRNPMMPVNNLAQSDVLYLDNVDNVDNFHASCLYASLSRPR